MEDTIKARPFVSSSMAIENLICVIIQLFGPIRTGRYFDRPLSKHANNQLVRVVQAACDPVMKRIGRAPVSEDKIFRVAREMKKASDALE